MARTVYVPGAHTLLATMDSTSQQPEYHYKPEQRVGSGNAETDKTATKRITVPGARSTPQPTGSSREGGVMRRARSWLSAVPASLVLLSLGGATEGVAYGPEGTFCLPLLSLTKAIEDGPKRSYAWEGACPVELASGPSMVMVQVKAFFHGTDREASERIEVAGPITGKFLTLTRGCTKDPFVVGSPACAGPTSVSLDGIVPNSVVPTARAANPPIMYFRVSANQAYTSPPPPPPPGAGQVRITKPNDRQSFVFGDKLAVEVRFAAANVTHPPTGGVALQWGHETSIGTCTFDVGYLGVQHYSMAQMLGKASFPQPGRYCLRATSKPGAGPVSTWEHWTAPVRIVIGERIAATSPGGSAGGFSAAGDKSGQGGAGKVARLPGPTLDDAVRQLQALEGRLMRLGPHAEAAKLLRDVRAYRTGLDQEPNDVAALQVRLRELTARVEGIEASVKKIQSTAPKATPGPSTKPNIGSQ